MAGTYDKNDPKQHLRLTDAEKKANRAEYDKKRRSQGAVHDSEAKRKKLSREQETVQEKQNRLNKVNDNIMKLQEKWYSVVRYSKDVDSKISIARTNCGKLQAQLNSLIQK